MVLTTLWRNFLGWRPIRFYWSPIRIIQGIRCRFQSYQMGNAMSFGTHCMIMARLSGNGPLRISKRPRMLPTKKCLTNSIRLWGVGGGSKALFLTQSNLVISGRLSPKWVLSHDFPSVSRWFSWGDCILVMSCNWIFNLCQQKHNKIITNTKMGTRDEYFNPNFTKLELTWHTREWPNR